MNLQIVDYKPEYQPAFESLNRAWIEKHFVMEPVDIAVLTDPEKHIMAHGGQILVALRNDAPVGVVALKKIDAHTYELTKMAVDESCRRAGIARQLMEACISRGRELGARALVLYSNTVYNAPAIALYRKMWFMETPMEKQVYERGNIRMEYQLTPFTKAQRDATIDSYGEGPEKIKAAVNRFPKEMLGWKPPSGKWSIYENIIHLADVEANAYIRFRKFLAEPGSSITAYDENKWVELTGDQQTVEEALEIVRVLRKSTCRLLKAAPEAAWSHTLHHPDNGVIVLTNWLRLYENHTHIGQMNRVYNEWLRQNSQDQKPL